MPSDVLAIIILIVVVALIGLAVAAMGALIIGTILNFMFRKKPVDDLDVSFREQLAVCKVNHAPHRKNLYMLDVPHMTGLQREMIEFRKGLKLLRMEVEPCQKKKLQSPSPANSLPQQTASQ
jgi:hypothetical protein